MSAAQKPKCRNSRRSKRTVIRLFTLILLLLSCLYAEVADNAVWLQSTVSSSLVLPDSLLTGSSVFIKETEQGPLQGLFRQSVIERLQKPGCAVTAAPDTAAPIAFTLEYQMAGASVKFSKIFRDRFYKPKKFKRTAAYEMHVNIFSSKDGRLVWTGTSAGSRTEDLLYSEIDQTKSILHPDLNAAADIEIAPKLFDGIILLGTVVGVIYFLYR